MLNALEVCNLFCPLGNLEWAQYNARLTRDNCFLFLCREIESIFLASMLVCHAWLYAYFCRDWRAAIFTSIITFFIIECVCVCGLLFFIWLFLTLLSAKFISLIWKNKSCTAKGIIQLKLSTLKFKNIFQISTFHHLLDYYYLKSWYRQVL